MGKVKNKVNTKIKANKPKAGRLGIKRFIGDTQLEMRRVTWPNRSDVISASGVILLIVVFLTVFVSLVDVSFSRVLFWLKTVIQV